MWSAHTLPLAVDAQGVGCTADGGTVVSSSEAHSLQRDHCPTCSVHLQFSVHLMAVATHTHSGRRDLHVTFELRTMIHLDYISQLLSQQLCDN